MKRLLLILVAVFVLIQLIRPSFTAPPVDPAKTLGANAQVPPNVGAIFERACNDCHSNKTIWPWYAQVAPVSWWLKNHVTTGRREVNFSEWGTYSQKKRLRKLEEICEQVNKGEMPLKTYLPMHPAARLSAADKNAICDWTNAERVRLGAK